MLKNYKFHNKMIPMLICTELYSRNTTFDNFKDFHSNLFSSLDKVILDFPCKVKYEPEFDERQEPLSNDLSSDEYSRIDYFNQLSSLKNVIPCISLHSQDFNDPEEAIERFQSDLINTNRLVYSIHPSGNNEELSEYVHLCINAINKLGRQGDIVIYNLNGKHPDSNKAQEHLDRLAKNLSKEFLDETYIFVCSPKNLTRSKVPNGSYKNDTIAKKCIRYQLHKKIRRYPFKGISDFSGMDHIIPALTKPRNRHRPVYLASDYTANNIWGFVGKDKSKKEYEFTVYPRYIRSKHWSKFNNKAHTSICPGCSKISKMKKGAIPVDGAKWREIILLHHLTEMKTHL